MNTETVHIRPGKMDGRSSVTTSSRAAANLSLERLHRKRAIDRDNQRVLRQKNKARLAELEQEVKTLTAKLEQVEAEKALQAAQTQSSSASIDSIISSLRALQMSLGQLRQTPAAMATTPTPTGSPSSAAMAASSASPSASLSDAGTGAGGGRGGTAHLPPLGSPTHSSADTLFAGNTAAQQHQSYHPTPGEATAVVALGLDNLDFWGAGASVTVPVDGPVPFSNRDFSLDLDLLTRSLPLFHSDLHSNSHSTNNAAHHNNHATEVTTPHTQSHVDFQAPSPSPSLSTSSVSDSLRKNPHDDTGAVYLARLEANRLRDASPIWAITPSYVPPTANIDELIINLVCKRREEGQQEKPTPFVNNNTIGNSNNSGSSIGGGTSDDEFTHANFPSVSSLLNPVLYEPDKPVASIIARHVVSTIMVYTTPEKTALLYIMCVLIRWLISPTKEHYDSIPEFFRPTGAQLLVPHPFWIDTIGWPRARERLIRHLDFTKYRSFASIIVKSFSISWPHHQLEGILEGTPEKGFVMTHAFIQHVREPANWTVGPELIEAFPFLAGTMNVRGRPPVSF